MSSEEHEHWVYDPTCFACYKSGPMSVDDGTMQCPSCGFEMELGEDGALPVYDDREGRNHEVIGTARPDDSGRMVLELEPGRMPAPQPQFTSMGCSSTSDGKER